MSTDGNPVPTVFQIQDDQEFDLTFEGDDKAGNKGVLDPATPITVSVSDPALLAIVQKDPLTYTVSSTGKVGSGQVSVKATVNGTDVTGSLSIEIVPGAVDHLTLTPSVPRSKS